MNIQPIVEGYGDVEAFPVLLRKLGRECGRHDISINRPLRRKRSEFTQEGSLRASIRLALLQPRCDSILILFDGDGKDDCPKTMGPEILKWARQEARHTPCAVAIAFKEYEAWLLAAVESLRGTRGIKDDADPHPAPESPRDAKGELERRMVPGRSYSATADQAALTARFDMAMAFSRCRSFRHLVKAYGDLCSQLGVPLSPWPPSSWCPGRREYP